MTQETTVLKSIFHFIFGYRYWACIIGTTGTERTEFSSYIFRSRKEVREYKERLSGNRSYYWIETVKVKSRRGWYTKAETLY